MIGIPRADPADAGRARQLDREIGRVGHHQMADAVVAIDQRGRRRALQHLDVGLGIDPAGLDPVARSRPGGRCRARRSR